MAYAARGCWKRGKSPVLQYEGTMNIRLGRAIRLCRRQRELSQTELASAAGISFSYLSLLERGKRDPTLSTVEKIAAALAVPVIILIFLAESDERTSGLSAELLEKLSYKALQFAAGD